MADTGDSDELLRRISHAQQHVFAMRSTGRITEDDCGKLLEILSGQEASATVQASVPDTVSAVITTPELLERILCYLSPMDLLLRCKLVSTYFRDAMASSPMLRRKMFIESRAGTGRYTFPHQLSKDFRDLWSLIASLNLGNMMGGYAFAVKPVPSKILRKCELLSTLKMLQPSEALTMGVKCGCVNSYERLQIARSESIGEYVKAMEEVLAKSRARSGHARHQDHRMAVVTLPGVRASWHPCLGPLHDE